MRKHDVRKWLHAILDLLPLAVLPIFAIYMRNENSTRDISVDYSLSKVVNFNQQINFTNNYSNIYSFINDNVVVYDNYFPTDGFSFIYKYDLIPSHVYIYKDLLISCASYTDVDNEVSADVFPRVRYNGSYVNLAYSDYWSDIRFVCNNSEFIVNFGSSSRNYYYDMSSSLQLFDLTQMFGSGNEPSLEQFNNWYTDSYYSYNTGTKQLLKNYSTVTYDDTDVGSQMMYSLYKPVKEYFNFNNVFNFGAIYDWFSLNLFGGNPPMSAFIVWNIILYEFIMDVIFLTYSVFMFIIDFVECALDKAFGKSYRGGR